VAWEMHDSSDLPPSRCKYFKGSSSTDFLDFFSSLRTDAFITMATLSIDGLETLLRSLDLETPIPRFPECDVLTNPLDIFRAYLTEALSKLLDCESSTILSAINLPQGMLGDLEVIVPRLKIKGQKPNELAFELCRKVCIHPRKQPE
jgi:hypothetical protein